jgi:hypothetical protein
LGFEALGHNVVYLGRDEVLKDADLVVQTSFGHTLALSNAMERGVPYLIMEAPPFRTMQPWEHWSSFGYNGLAGGAYRPEAPDEVREHPRILPLKTEGKTLIIGQKPTDHSLRGSDHVGWLLGQREANPDAELRHHPLMVADQTSIERGLEDVKKVIVYTSTVAVDAALAGCEVVVDGPGCWWRAVGSREEQCHELSWAAFTHEELASARVADHILNGYEEALTVAPEIPRGKIDGKAICEQYYKYVV